VWKERDAGTWQMPAKRNYTVPGFTRQAFKKWDLLADAFKE
jgi:hypothetical protein